MAFIKQISDFEPILADFPWRKHFKILFSLREFELNLDRFLGVFHPLRKVINLYSKCSFDQVEQGGVFFNTCVPLLPFLRFTSDIKGGNGITDPMGLTQELCRVSKTQIQLILQTTLQDKYHLARESRKLAFPSFSQAVKNNGTEYLSKKSSAN